MSDPTQHVWQPQAAPIVYSRNKLFNATLST